MSDTPPGLRHVEHVMGTVFSFDIRDNPTPAIRHALAEAVRQLHRVDEVFSTYRADSHISRLARGEIRQDACPPEVHEVLSLCAQATHATDGWFSIVPAGTLDPSGLVKGWATEAASQLLHDAGRAAHVRQRRWRSPDPRPGSPRHTMAHRHRPPSAARRTRHRHHRPPRPGRRHLRYR